MVVGSGIVECERTTRAKAKHAATWKPQFSFASLLTSWLALPSVKKKHSHSTHNTHIDRAVHHHQHDCQEAWDHEGEADAATTRR